MFAIKPPQPNPQMKCSQEDFDNMLLKWQSQALTGIIGSYNHPTVYYVIRDRDGIFWDCWQIASHSSLKWGNSIDHSQMPFPNQSLLDRSYTLTLIRELHRFLRIKDMNQFLKLESVRNYLHSNNYSETDINEYEIPDLSTPSIIYFWDFLTNSGVFNNNAFYPPQIIN